MDRPSKLHQLVPMLTTTNPSCWAKYVTATTDPLSASKRRECDLGSWFTGVTAAFAAGFLSPCQEHCELVIMVERPYERTGDESPCLFLPPPFV